MLRAMGSGLAGGIRAGRCAAGAGVALRRRGASGKVWREKWVSRQDIPDPVGNSRQHRVRQGLQSKMAERYGSGDAEQKRLTVELARLGRQSLWEEALALYAAVPEPDPILSASALDVLAKSRRLHQASLLFDSMPQKAPSAYNSLVCLLVRLGRTQEAEQRLQEMREAGVAADETTFLGIIGSHAYRGEMAQALEVFQKMRAAGIPATAIAYRGAIHACARAGDVRKAKELLAQMESESVAPQASHLKCVMSACQPSRDEAAATEAFADLRRRGFEPDVIAYTILVSCHEGPGATERAGQVFSEMKEKAVEPNVFAYNALLSVAVRNGEAAECRRVLAEMEAAGVGANHETSLLVRRLEESERCPTAPVAEAAAAADPLPAGWGQATDPSSGSVYYWLESDPAGTVTWQRPPRAR